jgi:hypothetical protein
MRSLDISNKTLNELLLGFVFHWPPVGRDHNRQWRFVCLFLGGYPCADPFSSLLMSLAYIAGVSNGLEIWKFVPM